MRHNIRDAATAVQSAAGDLSQQWASISDSVRMVAYVLAAVAVVGIAYLVMQIGK